LHSTDDRIVCSVFKLAGVWMFSLADRITSFSQSPLWQICHTPVVDLGQVSIFVTHYPQYLQLFTGM